MEIAVKTLFLGLNPKLINRKQSVDLIFQNQSCKSPNVHHRGYCAKLRETHRCFTPLVSAVLSGTPGGVCSSPSCEFEEFSVTASPTAEPGELRISVEVSGVRTRAIFNDVFDKMVAAAQPIPGFRRVKGGKTPDIPRDILLEVLGPSKVYKEVIKKVINSTIAEYVEKERLKVGKDLRVEQSFEDLDDVFEPDEKFSFDAVIQIQTNE
ncbi:uncharacterized protein LOC126654466 [Mercurialis annua]|uniref:uncharacterized protein LOC126654466 n=1 Tax=Mercurialis annua TaxID=3986 RepID=UPI00215FC14C|nr:uncharacterized protein LOC126654466 [Mercurialis annua]